MRIQCLHPYVRTLSGVFDDSGFPVQEVFPCGKCPVCRASDARDWMFRLQVECDNSVNVQFLTLTYNEKNVIRIGTVPILNQSDFQLFIKRLRSRIARKYPDAPKLRFFAVGEYGGNTHRPHYHAILFNLPSGRDVRSIIEKAWGKGFITLSPVNSNRIAYVANYSLFSFLLGDDKNTEIPRPFRVMSRKPGIGYQYVTDRRFRYILETNASFAQYHSFKYRFPRFYKDRFFITEEDRERLHSEAARHNKQDNAIYKSLYGEIDKQRMAAGIPTIMEDFEKQYIENLRKKYIIHKLHRKI